MERHYRFALFLFLIFTASCRNPVGHAPDSHPKADQRETNSTLFEGSWQVSSASYQLSGPIYYTFEGDTLTIESRQANEKRLNAPQHVSITQWKIEIDDTKSPQRLIMTKLGGPGAPDTARVEAFEFRDGGIWMRRDYGDPITAELLNPGKGGRVTGLTRIE